MMATERGFTLIELLVAAGLLIMTTALTCLAFNEARTAADTVLVRGDLHQRARVALDRIGSALRGAGAGADRGPAAGPLHRWLPPIRPGLGDVEDTTPAVTVLAVVTSIGPALLASAAGPDASTLEFTFVGCSTPCGFSEGLPVALVHPDGDFDIFVIQGIDGSSAGVAPTNFGTGGWYPIGAAVLPVDVRTYYFSERGRELRVFDGHRSDLPVVNDVVDVGFEYFTTSDTGGFTRLLPQTFADGPWRGTGGSPVDLDLLRIRAVKVRIRCQSTDDAHRGGDRRFFRNPGRAMQASMLIHDLELTTTVAPPNLNSIP